MPRNIKKLDELQQQLNKKDLEIAKYRQLISNIQAIITINGVKPTEQEHLDLIAGERRTAFLKPDFKELTIEEQTEHLYKRLDKEGLKLITDGQHFIIKSKYDKEINEILKRDNELKKKPDNVVKAAKEKIKQEDDSRPGETEEEYHERKETPKPEPKKCINCQDIGYWEGRSFCPKCEKSDYIDENDAGETETPKSHVDELKELQKKGINKPSKIKKVIKRQPHALDELREKATEATATANQNLTLEERIAKLPPEAQAQIRANEARAKAAEREKHHGKEGDAQYARLVKKEQQEKGELPLDGTCPHCKEQLEAPIMRGYHQECWEAKQKRETQQ